MMKYIVYSFFIVMGLSSCDSGSVYEQNVAINDRNWTYEQKPTFIIPINDNSAKYNIYINLRHTNQYDYSNFFVLLNEKGNKLKDSTIRKEIKLSELDGRWLGKSSGSLYEIEYLAKENYSFPDTGKYTFTLEQNMRISPLKDVVDVGIKVVKK